MADCNEIYDLQIKSFASLLKKYHDFDFSPGAEKIDKTIMNERRNYGLFAMFILWTVAIKFAALNQFFHKLTGVHMMLYTITDWLDGYYVLVMEVYVLFEVVVINYRPVLINGYLEVSYPSSTTMLVMCVMPTAIMQFRSRMKNSRLRKGLISVLVVFTVFMVAGRLWSGVHWFTDIVGGALLSAGLVMLYRTVAIGGKYGIFFKKNESETGCRTETGNGCPEML